MKNKYKITISANELKNILQKYYQNILNNNVTIKMEPYEEDGLGLRLGGVTISYLCEKKIGSFTGTLEGYISISDIINIINESLSDTNYVTDEIFYIVENDYDFYDRYKGLNFKGIVCQVREKSMVLERK